MGRKSLKKLFAGTLIAVASGCNHGQKGDYDFSGEINLRGKSVYVECLERKKFGLSFLSDISLRMNGLEYFDREADLKLDDIYDNQGNVIYKSSGITKIPCVSGIIFLSQLEHLARKGDEKLNEYQRQYDETIIKIGGEKSRLNHQKVK
ncbi:MAG: hypothetical protein AABX73_02595 [Nanoarchaeota archaeon]